MGRREEGRWKGGREEGRCKAEDGNEGDGAWEGEARRGKKVKNTDKHNVRNARGDFD